MSSHSLLQNFRAVVPIVAGVGNALMALPMVRQLKSRGRAGHVTVVARSAAMAEPFRRVPEVDDVIVAGGSRKMVGAIRSVGDIDLLIVPFPSNRWQYSLLAAASGARMKLLHDYPVGRWRAMHFIGTRVPAVRGIHDVEQNLRLLRAIDVDPDLSESPRFVVSDDDRQRAGALLDADDFIALHAGSARTLLAAAKRWPTDRYATLIEQLRREAGCEIVILEGPDETGVADEITAHSPHPARVCRLAGNLGTAAAVLERATFYVGSDSGLAHLAASVGKRAVTIFAPADPDRVCPHGNRDLVVKPDKPCSPCFLYPWHAAKPKMCCGQHGHPMCINDVTVEQVMKTVTRLIQERAATHVERA